MLIDVQSMGTLLDIKNMTFSDLCLAIQFGEIDTYLFESPVALKRGLGARGAEWEQREYPHVKIKTVRCLEAYILLWVFNRANRPLRCSIANATLLHNVKTS